MSSSILLRQVATLLRTAVDHISDDPVVFAMQVARLLPSSVPRTAGRALSFLPGPVAKASTAWLRGDVSAASEYVRARAHSSHQALILGELALSLGDRATAARGAKVNGHTAAGRRLAARIEWNAGRMSEAVNIAPAGRMRERLTSELRTFQPEWKPIGTTPGAAPMPRGLPRVDVLFALTNSMPHTQSGYTLRSHAVLGAVRDAGARVVGANRTGYPTSVGRPLLRDRARVDGIDYLFDIPPRLGRTPEDRLEQQANFLIRVASATGAQVIHTTTHFTNGLAAQAAATALSVPWVYEVRGSLEDTWATSRGEDEVVARKSERFTLFRAREAQVAAEADHVITLGRTMAEELVGRGVAPEKILVAPNSVGSEILDADWRVEPASVRDELGLPRQGVWVGTAASIVGYEGLDVLVDAVAMARESGADIRLLIVGDGVELPTLRLRAQTLGEAAVFTGRLPSARARRHVQALDIFVVPRKDVAVCRMITPLKPVEAGGLGRAVVLSDLPALTEALPADAQRTVEAGSSESLAGVLVNLATDSGERGGLGCAARRYVEENRTWASLGHTYRRVYEGLGVSMRGGRG